MGYPLEVKDFYWIAASSAYFGFIFGIFFMMIIWEGEEKAKQNKKKDDDGPNEI